MRLRIYDSCFEKEKQMAIICTHCENTGFINLIQVDDIILKAFDRTGEHQIILDWIEKNDEHDVSVCDCCGDGETWYGIPGEHYNPDDPRGNNGPVCL